MNQLRIKLGVFTTSCFFACSIIAMIMNYKNVLERKMYGYIAFDLTFHILFACLICTYIRDRNKPHPWQYEWIVLLWYFKVITDCFDLNDKKEYSDPIYFVAKFAFMHCMLITQQILITVTCKNIKIKILTVALLPFIAIISHAVVFEEWKLVFKFFSLALIGFCPALFSFVYF